MRWTIAAALGAFVVIGCNPDQRAAPTELETRAAVGGDEKVTTGGAAVTFRRKCETKDDPSCEIINRLSFVAQREGVGVAADGQFEYTGLIGDFFKEETGQIHGVVQCFLLYGKDKDNLNSATVEGVITHATDPKLEGLVVFWDVTDNGEGGGDPPDLSSILFLGKTACLKPASLALFEIETGNVQVHPAN